MLPTKVDQNYLSATQEQAEILNTQTPVICINALAGTGKTTTLKLYTQQHPGKTFLYLCYNKSIADEAKSSFPANVKVQTMHSLAYTKVGHRYKENLKIPLSIQTVIKSLGLEKSARKEVLAMSIIKTLERWFASSDLQINSSHVPKDFLSSTNITTAKTSQEIDIILKKVANITTKLWNKMLDPINNEPMTHDGYLKLYTTQPHKINYDYILIDEAQDLSSCFIDVIERQKSNLILVGDVNQSIYLWRGATNYLKQISPQAKRLSLSTSFRFGPELALLTNCVLGYYEEYQPIKSSETNQTSIKVSSSSVFNWQANKDKKYSHAIIARQNTTLYEKLIELREKQIPCVLEGGINYKEVKDLEDLYNFKNTGKTQNPLYEGFKSYDEITNKIMTGQIEDVDLHKKVVLVGKWGNKFTKKLQMLKDYWQHSSKPEFKDIKPEIVLSTVHKAKGKEYDSVEVCDDFISHISIHNKENQEICEDKELKRRVSKTLSFKNQTKQTQHCLGVINNKAYIEEMNIFYVAITRAKKCLYLPQEYYNSLEILKTLMKYGNNEKFKEICFKHSIYVQDNLISLYEKHRLSEIICVNPAKVNDAVKKPMKI